MSEVQIANLEPTRAGELLNLMRATWQDTYVNTRLMPQEVLEASLPDTAERVRAQEKTLARQYVETDETMPQYFGAFDESEVLVGFIKVAKPLEDLNRYGGHENWRQKFARKVLRRPAKLIDPALVEILEINVHPNEQRKGIGTLLVNRALDSLPEDTESVRLFTRLTVQSFFKRFGFKVNSERSFYPDATDESGISLYGMAAAVTSLQKVEQ